MQYLLQLLLVMAKGVFEKAREVGEKKLLPYPVEIIIVLLMVMGVVAFIVFFITGSEVAIWWTVGFLMAPLLVEELMMGWGKRIQRHCTERQQWGILALVMMFFGGLAVAFVVTV